MTNNKKPMDNKTDFQNMFHSNHVIMLLIDPNNGKIVDANVAACQFYGYPYKKLVKEIKIYDINILTKSEIKIEMEEALNDIRNYFKFKHKLSSGEIKDVDVYSSKMSIDDKDYLFSIIHDMTKSRKAEEKLRQSTQMHHKLIESIPDIVYRYSNKKGAIYWSPTIKKILGYNPSVLKTKPFLWIESIIDEDIDIVNKAISKFAKGIDFEMEYRIKDKAGKLHWFRDRSISRTVLDDEVIIEGIASDITKQKLAEIALRKSEEKFQILYDNSPDMYVSVSPIDANILLCNKTLLKNTGYSKKEVIGFPIYKMYHNDCMSKVKKHFKEFTKKGIIKDKELILKRKDGSKIEVNLNVNSVKDEFGNILNSISSWRDITERKLVEQELIQSESNYKNLIDSSSDFIFLVDNKNIVLAANQAAARSLGKKSQDIIGKHVDKLFPIEVVDNYMQNLLKAFKTGKNATYESTLQNGDQTIWLSTILNPVKDSTGRITSVMGISRNITENKIGEKSLLTAKEQAENYLNIAAGIIVSLDKKGNITLINDNGSNLLGYKPGELIGKNWFDTCIPKPINKNVQIVFNELMVGQVKNVTNYENNVITKDGSEKTIYWHNTLIYDNENKIFELLSSGVDITEHRLAEMDILNWKNRYESAIESSGNILYDWDSATNEVIYYGTVEKTLGYSLNEISGELSKWINLIHPDDREYFTKTIENITITKKSVQLEYRIRKKNGDYIMIEDTGQFIKEVDDKITRMIGFAKDITVRKEIENELTNSQKLYQDLYDKAPDMYFSIDKEDKIISVNQNGAEYLGYTKTQLIGNKVWMVVHKDDILDVKKQLEKILLSCKIIKELEFRKVKKDGTIIFVQEQIQCICDDSGNVKELRIVCRDITEINKNKQKILDYQNNLRLMTHEMSRIEEREKRELAYKLHDVIGQSMAMAKIKLGEISKNMSFENVQKNIDLAKSLVVDAIKKSRDLTYELSPPILYELGLVAAINWYSSQISKLYNIKIHINGIKESLGCSEEIKIIIYRSIVELLNNIIKYSHATKAVITINEFKNHGKITIRDNGRGFNSDNTQVLTKSKKFGLFSIKERIEYIGGEFKIESKMKVGTTATIKIPTEK